MKRAGVAKRLVLLLTFVAASGAAADVPKAPPADAIGDALVTYATQGDVEALRVVLGKTPSALHGARSQIGDTPLITAAREGHLAVVEFLIKAGAALDELDAWKSWTALMWACARGHEDVVRALLRSGADARLENPFGETALMTATDTQHEDVARIIRDAGGAVSPDAALRRAISHGDLGAVQRLLEARLDPNRPDRDGATPLIQAAEHSTPEIVAALLDSGARIDDRQPHYAPDTALGRAIAGGEEIATLLESRGARLAPEEDLVLSAEHGNVKRLKALIAKGLSPDALDLESGETALVAAAIASRIDSVRALLAAGASNDLAARDGLTPLLAAASYGMYQAPSVIAYDVASGATLHRRLRTDQNDDHDAVIRSLLESKAAVAARDPQGRTALMLECEQGHATPMRELLAAGAFPRACDGRGETKSAQIVRAWLALARRPKDPAAWWAEQCRPRPDRSVVK